MPNDDKPRTVETVIGANLRRLRGHRTFDEMAAKARRMGLDWQRETYRAMEAGEKTLDLAEAVLVSFAFDFPSVADLLAGVGSVHLSERATIRLDALRSLMGAGPMPEGGRVTVKRDRQREVEAAAKGEVEIKAARKLSDVLGRRVEPLEVSEAAFQLWKRSVTDQRDALLGDTAGESPRTIQARRGRVTRGLLDELEPELKGRRR